MKLAPLFSKLTAPGLENEPPVEQDKARSPEPPSPAPCPTAADSGPNPSPPLPRCVFGLGDNK